MWGVFFPKSETETERSWAQLGFLGPFLGFVGLQLIVSRLIVRIEDGELDQRDPLLTAASFETGTSSAYAKRKLI